MSRLIVECQHRFPGGFRLDVHFRAVGGVTAVFGPSGSGKSTTLAFISGLMRPQQGRIELGGTVLLDTRRRVFVPPDRRKIGFVFQDHLLFPHLTIRANLRYGARRRPTRRIEFDRVVEILELGAMLDRYPRTLSGGQRQRAALGRAILRGPELLLMDEPLTALDLGLKERILTYLERVVKEYHLPTLFVSHDQTDVRRLADHVVVVEAGRTVNAGPTRETLDEAVTRKMRSHPGPTNLLRVDDLKRINGHLEGCVNGQQFRLPNHMRVDAPSCYVRFLAHDVVVGEHDVTGLSIRNQLHGEIREVVKLPGRAFVAVDVGQFLWTEVTLDSVRDLHLKPGHNVTCLIKTSALQAAE